MADSLGIGIDREQLMSEGHSGPWYILQRFLPLQMDKKNLTGGQAIQGQPRADEGHGTDLGCNIEFMGDILRVRHESLSTG
jgi:hypothetical protein